MIPDPWPLPEPIYRRLVLLLATWRRDWNRGGEIVLNVDPQGIVTRITPRMQYELTREELAKIEPSRLH